MFERLRMSEKRVLQKKFGRSKRKMEKTALLGVS